MHVEEDVVDLPDSNEAVSIACDDELDGVGVGIVVVCTANGRFLGEVLADVGDDSVSIDDFLDGEGLDDRSIDEHLQRLGCLVSKPDDDPISVLAEG